MPAGSTPNVTNPASSKPTIVTLSYEAKELTRVAPIPQPNTPEIGNIKAGVEQYTNIQAAKMKSQVASDMTCIAMGTNEGISAPTTDYEPQWLSKGSNSGANGEPTTGQYHASLCWCQWEY